MDKVQELKAQLQALPGAAPKLSFELLNRASRVLSSNAEEFRVHVAKFVGTARMPAELEDDYEHELVRLFHNYLASVGTLRDIQRVVLRTYWPQKAGTGKKKVPSEWESTVYSPRLKEVFDPDTSFILKLRDYVVHYSLPAFGVGTSIAWADGDNQFSQANTIRLKKAELLKWDGWGANAKAFLSAAGERIEFLPLVEAYMASVRAFFDWFWKQIEIRQKHEIDEYKAKGKEFWLWYAQNNVRPDWIEKDLPMPHDWSAIGPLQMRRKRAQARSDRFANGSNGWRLIAVDGNGHAEVGDSDWSIPD